MPQGEDIVEFRVPVDHPSLPGHFPGEPLLPGVALLDRVMEVAEDRLPAGRRITGVPRVKFLAPLRPDDVAEITVGPEEEGLIPFRVHRNGEPVAQGVLATAPVDAAP